jgi:hypothetical protein
MEEDYGMHHQSSGKWFESSLISKPFVVAECGVRKMEPNVFKCGSFFMKELNKKRYPKTPVL